MCANTLWSLSWSNTLGMLQLDAPSNLDSYQPDMGSVLVQETWLLSLPDIRFTALDLHPIIDGELDLMTVSSQFAILVRQGFLNVSCSCRPRYILQVEGIYSFSWIHEDPKCCFESGASARTKTARTATLASPANRPVGLHKHLTQPTPLACACVV